MSTAAKPDADVSQAQKGETTKFTLREARLTDVNSIAAVWYKAFFDDEIIGDMIHPYRKEYPEDVHYFLLKGVREHFWDWRHQFIVVVATDEKGIENVVGAADWRRLGQGRARRELYRIDPRKTSEYE
jgi:hypothetical protein